MRYVRIVWHTSVFLLDRFATWLAATMRAMWRESDLFLGLLFTTVGLLHIHIGRFCDGNSADYLSCTRPAVFYYYSALEITIIAIGVILIAVWLLARRDK